MQIRCYSCVRKFLRKRGCEMREVVRHSVPKVGDTVRLNRFGITQIWGTDVGLSFMMEKKMKVISIESESLTFPEETFALEVDDVEINRFLLDNWCFDIVESAK